MWSNRNRVGPGRNKTGSSRQGALATRDQRHEKLCRDREDDGPSSSRCLGDVGLDHWHVPAPLQRRKYRHHYSKGSTGTITAKESPTACIPSIIERFSLPLCRGSIAPCIHFLSGTTNKALAAVGNHVLSPVNMNGRPHRGRLFQFPPTTTRKKQQQPGCQVYHAMLLRAERSMVQGTVRLGTGDAISRVLLQSRGGQLAGTGPVDHQHGKSQRVAIVGGLFCVARHSLRMFTKPEEGGRLMNSTIGRRTGWT